MYYETHKDYIDANSKSAYEIAKKLNAEDKEELEMVLDFLVNKLEEYHKLLGWHEKATIKFVGEKNYGKILIEANKYMREDFVKNCEWAKELHEKGLI